MVVSGDPDITGDEGDECLYYEPDEFLNHGKSECNDLMISMILVMDTLILFTKAVVEVQEAVKKRPYPSLNERGFLRFDFKTNIDY